MSARRFYRIVILSSIPVYRCDGKYFSVDLWVRDLEAQASVAKVQLICPVSDAISQRAIAEIDSRIHIHPYEQLREALLEEIILAADVVQIHGNSGWRGSRAARRLLNAARRAGKVAILGVSSNRAQTALLNVVGKGFFRKVKGYLSYVDIRLSQSWLAVRADGVFVVGHGLTRLFARLNKNIHVGTASWIKDSDIRVGGRDVAQHPLMLCIASRLERMKGIHVGISAIKNLVDRSQIQLRLVILGEGPERLNLQQQVEAAGLSAITTFSQPVAYPQPFLSLLGSMDIVLLTNLNDEQPRLVMDALSQGCLPICPDTPSYGAFSLPKDLLYEQGNALDLSRTILALSDFQTRDKLRGEMSKTVRIVTIDAMHRERAAWINSLLPDRTI